MSIFLKILYFTQPRTGKNLWIRHNYLQIKIKQMIKKHSPIFYKLSFKYTKASIVLLELTKKSKFVLDLFTNDTHAI
jgi:hypothetical protein